jgi:hypothetical protein
MTYTGGGDKQITTKDLGITVGIPFVIRSVSIEYVCVAPTTATIAFELLNTLQPESVVASMSPTLLSTLPRTLVLRNPFKTYATITGSGTDNFTLIRMKQTAFGNSQQSAGYAFNGIATVTYQPLIAPRLVT